MSIRANIPDGYELFSGRNRDVAREALAAASERGYPAESVLTVHDGYFVPLGADVVETIPGTEGNEPVVIEGQPVPEGEDVKPAVVTFDESAKVADIDAFIDANELDVDKSLKKSDKIDAVRAALEAKGE